jgi:hypothetical protein
MTLELLEEALLVEDALLLDELLDEALLVEDALLLAELLDEVLLVDEVLLFNELLEDAVAAAVLADDELLSSVSPPQPLSAKANTHVPHQAKIFLPINILASPLAVLIRSQHCFAASRLIRRVFQVTAGRRVDV